MVQNVIISFAGGPNRDQYIAAGMRLMKQARETGLFNQNMLYTDEYLKNDKEFWSKHGDFINKNARGFGYYIWKPYLIKKTMAQLNDGDKLMWLDCGCEIGLKKKEALSAYLKYVETDYIIGSKNGIEREWTKVDLIVKLDMMHAKYLENFQRQGGAVLMLVCDKTRVLIDEWYDLCCNYHLLDDSPDDHERLGGFKEHRHDQSIFSLVSKKHNLFSEHPIENAVYILRNNTGVSCITT